MTKKQTPLTLELFEEFLMPKFDKKLDKLELKINHLPTKDEYYKREDKTMGELQKLREEVTVVNHQYNRTNSRVDAIDLHLGISTADL